jgi:hypothetical protein
LPPDFYRSKYGKEVLPFNQKPLKSRRRRRRKKTYNASPSLSLHLFVFPKEVKVKD